ncbi:hypothetical protein Gotri_005368 [Gossypium trilobum]|uniref:Uncharacterized protein n=1 Tax=Gossypium trilobum TaxID=34281 RepID=A0A7J9EWR7_9ROSI|nr:hypothetical protein [Gossypium trilobum]
MVFHGPSTITYLFFII